MADLATAPIQPSLPLFETDLHAPPTPVGLGHVVQVLEGTNPAVIKIGKDAPFQKVREHAQALFEASNDAYRGQEAVIDVGDRRFDLFDLRRLSHLLVEEFGIYVVSVLASGESLRQHAERELKIPVHVIEPELELLAEENSAPAKVVCEVPAATDAAVEPETAIRDLASLNGEKLHTVHRTLRSGSVTRTRGDLLIVGDVNPGAQVHAGGNILVLGALKGEAHAGQRHLKDAFVFALAMSATSLRIGEHLAQTADAHPSSVENEATPRLAIVERNQIVIQPYRGRLPRRLD
jgi:septum site-determining protein MinC